MNLKWWEVRSALRKGTHMAIPSQRIGSYLPLFLPRARTRYLRMYARGHTILHKRDDRRRGRKYHFGFMEKREI